ncbi:MAG: hypothetical protein IAF00_09820 [Phycisphaerales bacterium]|nr:hypothetical protein [Phycisphaerales bacterium]
MRSSLALLLFTSLIPVAQAHPSHSAPIPHAIEHAVLGLVVFLIVGYGASLLHRRRRRS